MLIHSVIRVCFYKQVNIESHSFFVVNIRPNLAGLVDLNGHNFTLVCSDLSSLAIYARVHNSAYRILKAYTPGPYTFILKATSQVPKRLMHPKRKTIGLRVPDNAITQSILSSFGEPVMSTSLILPDEDEQLFDAYEMRTKIGKMVDLIIDGGACGLEPTTMIDLVEGVPEVMRIGKGDPEPFQ